MAINSLDIACDKSSPKSIASSNCSKPGFENLKTRRLLKFNFAAESSICSTASKRSEKKNGDSKSPYLNCENTNVQLLSHMTEKSLIHKKGADFVSSFPLAVNIYKANSDEFKSLKKANRKAKKSVLTLPNDPAPMPQICTVSDMNDSEYFNNDEDRKKIKKRNPVPRNRKPKSRNYEFYDRDACYCSQMNIDLDCSSTDMINRYAGERMGKLKSNVGTKQPVEEKSNPHDVWAVLRNINRFQFRPSPPMSEDSFIIPKKKKGTRRRNNRQDMRVVGTCRTEEIAYISSYEVDSRSPNSFSKSSSFDRITVIDKHDDFNSLCEEFEKTIVKTKNLARGLTNKPLNRNQNNKPITNRNTTKTNIKSMAQKPHNTKMLSLEHNAKKQFNCGDTTQNRVQTFDDTKMEFDRIPNGNDDSRHPNLIGEEVAKQEFINPGNSGCSKAVASTEKICKEGSNKFGLSSNDFYNPFNGITKVILSKGPAIPTPAPKQPEPPKRKRQASTGNNQPVNQQVIPKSTINTIIPKLTQGEIKRRLAHMKFPIVVLGKDQLSSTFEVQNTEPIQFNGLGDKVWPFMNQWQNKDEEKRENTLKTKAASLQKKKCTPEILEFNKIQKINRGLLPSRQINSVLKATIDSKNKNSSYVEQKRITPPDELLQSTQPKKPKPIRQFKEKMLKLLYKHSPIQNFAGENDEAGGNSDSKPKQFCKITSSKADASTEMNVRGRPKDMARNSINSPVKAAKYTSTTKQPWAKARWASDFIDNVIRKIKNGVYYTHESKLPNKKLSHECKEAEIQTLAMFTDSYKELQSISKITITKKHEPIYIPGFNDNILPALEITTMNTNEISVKHCVTNIIVHFDVTAPNEQVINLNRSSSLTPLDVTESQTKIYKCKTSIINGMLPAELCSILPKMMWNIIESREALALPPPLPQASVDKSALHLSTISEIQYENPEQFKHNFMPHLKMSLKLQKLINGSYSSRTAVVKRELKYIEAKYDEHFTRELLPPLSRSYLFDYKAQPDLTLKYYYELINLTPVKELNCQKQLNTCMALHSYKSSSRGLLLTLNQFNMTSFLRGMSRYVTGYIPSYSRLFNYFFDKNITINLTTTNSQGLENKLSINIGTLMTNINCKNIMSKASANTFELTDKKDLPAIKYVELKTPRKNNHNQATVIKKAKTKGFIKLYRKCKSTSNLTEKTTTSLSKITNLEDFFQVLGTAKLFSGVFDNMYAHKILSSLNEMKGWVSEISPTQALLVLLLMNKKDTPNLFRFRPVLLQGIAVNRITRANELDMEIEVIEKEHLNKLSRYEGISYLPASVENQDSLLEELCWIAKTTASDYQRTFDESSENLLKSLLEKRKKLNPSYLRVMARYVGLGLLKSPIKK